MIGTGLAIASAIGAGSSLVKGLIGSKAAGSAATQQQEAAQKAIDEQRGAFDYQKSNLTPYLDAGKSSLGKIMSGFENGTFGPGSIPGFKAPTAEEARATPGYQFTQQEGQRGVLASSAARGAGMGGGTLRALDRYNTGLAESTYGDTFSRALQQYTASLQGQQQSFNQLNTVSGMGLNAGTTLNQEAGQNASNIGEFMTQQGNAKAAGTMGKAQAWGNTIGDLSDIGQGLVFGGPAKGNEGAPQISPGIYGASPSKLPYIPYGG